MGNELMASYIFARNILKSVQLNFNSFFSLRGQYKNKIEPCSRRGDANLNVPLCFHLHCEGACVHVLETFWLLTYTYMAPPGPLLWHALPMGAWANPTWSWKLYIQQKRHAGKCLAAYLIPVKIRAPSISVHLACAKIKGSKFAQCQCANIKGRRKWMKNRQISSKIRVHEN